MTTVSKMRRLIKIEANSSRNSMPRIYAVLPWDAEPEAAPGSVLFRITFGGNEDPSQNSPAYTGATHGIDS